MKPMIPMPTCETCGETVKQRWRNKGQPTRFCSQKCIPRQLRVDAGRKGWKDFIVAMRLKLFRAELRRLQALPRITGQELSATFAAVYARAWDNGYSTCETKWSRRYRQRQGKVA